jgi:hypothetical protein
VASDRGRLRDPVGWRRDLRLRVPPFRLFAADVVAASRAAQAGPESWVSEFGAWQWDAITALGLAGVLLAAFTVAAAWRAHRRAALAGAVAWGAGAVALTGLVRHASPNSGGVLALWQLAAAGLLLAVVARLRAGGP